MIMLADQKNTGTGNAIKYLLGILTQVEITERDDALEQIWENLVNQKLCTEQINQEHCEKAVSECTGQGKHGSVSSLSVYDASDVPRFIYDCDQQKFLRVAADLLPEDISEKTSYYRNRYNVVYQRLVRHPMFTARPEGESLAKSIKGRLKPVEDLHGANSLVEDITVFGIITQIKLGAWYLEDLTGAVELDLSNATFGDGLVCDNTFVLCDGSFQNEVFTVSGLCLPPPEEALITRQQFGLTNFFGGESSTCASGSSMLKHKEKKNPGASIAFLSHVSLDDKDLMQRIHVFVREFNKCPPEAIVLCGPFLTDKYHTTKQQLLKDAFKKFADLLMPYTDLREKTHFIFVPDPEEMDVFFPTFPRPKIPSCLTTAFSKVVKNAVFSSNPCRIQYCTKEIVILREDLVYKMWNWRVYDPVGESDLAEHFCQTLASVASFSIPPLPVMPVLWTRDHTMSIYPLPDLVVTADNYFPFEKRVAGCTFINPGNFKNEKYSFKLYFPASGEVDDSVITNDMVRDLERELTDEDKQRKSVKHK